MSYKITDISSNSVTIHITYEEGFSQYRVFVREGGLEESGEQKFDNTFTSTESFDVTCSGLTASTKHTVNCRTVGEESAGWMGGTEFTTATDGGRGEGRPDNWSWSTTIATGAPVPLSSFGYLAPVSAADWNTLCARINEFRVYAGLSETSFTTVSSNQTITQAIVNEVLAAIAEIPGAGSLPTTTNPLEAAFYIQLAAALNAVP